jgi:1,4-dihydroxy-2-naphthoate octaprenyltransferase
LRPGRTEEMMMKQPPDLLGLIRAPFLILAPACALLGLGTAVWTTDSIDALDFVLALIGAVCAHISVNALNEYHDFKSGLDLKTERTPFSGGSGTLPAKPELASLALGAGLIAMAIAGLIGFYFLTVQGSSILPLGLLGLAVIGAYTRWLTRNPLLCLIAPGLGFGTLMVMGTDLVLSGGYSWTAFFASLVPFFLVSNLLLLNQFPDTPADQSIGRRHYPIVIGRAKSSLIYGGFLVLAYLSIVAGVWLGHLPAAALLGLLTLPIAVRAGSGAYRHADEPAELIPYQGMNVILNIVTPVLVAVGLFVG